jgi:prepilin-type N-terminal cleavage/methylation domain-containing protein
VEIRGQRGTSLIETTVALAIVAIVAGATLSAASVGARAAGSDTARSALQAAAQREMCVALDVLKYQGSIISPASVATALPMPAGSPLPATLSVQTAALSGGAISVAVTAATDSFPQQTATLRATVAQQAPLPGTRMRDPVLAPAPTGAP